VHKFVRSLITEWRRLKLPVADETIVVAVSGGADSLSLLLALHDLLSRKKLDLRIVTAHFNHKLRGRESDADEEFIKQFASDRGFELALGHGAIGEKGNTEQNARRSRYDFLSRTAENLKAGYVLTAHTLNDQAETFLLNLIRGSGSDGLSGMRSVRDLESEEERSGEGEELGLGEDNTPILPFSYTLLVRPLLRWAQREETENFCHESGVEFRYDTMNEDMSFKRVRIRKMLLPMLREFNPRIIETLGNTALLMQKAADSSVNGPHDQLPDQLSVKELKDMGQGPLYQTLRFWLKQQRGDLRTINRKHIEAIGNLALSVKSGKTVELPGFGVVRKQNGQLVFENIKVD
jgi:tRNA(Ile)-lysidine synthase